MRNLLIGSVIISLFPFLLASCVLPTTIRETHVLQAKKKDGTIGYYRIYVDGKASLAKTNYRAGLYDAEALDALTMGDSKGQTTPVDETLERRRREAVQNISGKYYTALEKPEDSDDNDTNYWARRLATSMQSPYVIAGKALSGSELPPPRRKYVIIFSALASEIEEAIASFAEEKETTETVLTAIAGAKREEFIKAKGRENELKLSLAVINKVKGDAEAIDVSTIKSAEELEKFYDSVRRLLQDVATLSN